MFRRLTQDDRSCLAGVSRLKSCTKGDQIFGEGEPSIVNAFLIVAVFPFTRLVHILVIPNPYLWRKPQVVRWHGPSPEAARDLRGRS